jgi:hypothetical protein
MQYMRGKRYTDINQKSIHTVETAAMKKIREWRATFPTLVLAAGRAMVLRFPCRTRTKKQK